MEDQKKNNLNSDKKINELEKSIVLHRKLYYSGNPQITDEAYDSLEEQLRAIAPNHPLFEQVGSEEVLKESSFSKVPHEPKMLSLNKVYTLEEYLNWLPKEAKEGVVTPKVDGFAVKLAYQKQGSVYVLETGATRGNGSVGEDVTENIKQVHDIPHEIEASALSEAPESFQVRGECYMKKSRFAVLSKEEDSVESCRNVAPGSIRNKDPRVTKQRGLNFFAYNILGLNTETMTDNFHLLASIGFVPVEHQTIHLQDKPEEIFKQWDTRRTEEVDDYYIDGIVFMVNDLSLFNALGTTAHHPRGAIAWKFKSEETETTLREVQWSVSRTGLINPVGIYDKVFIEGANLTNATLHNISQVKELGLGIGDRIVVARQGGVIPKIIRVKESKGSPIVPPSTCPACSWETTVKNEAGIETLHCMNSNCPAVTKAKLLHFIRMMEIEDIADSMISKLFDAGLILEPADIYKVTVDDIESFFKSGKKIAEKLINNINAARKRSLHQLLNALGIPTLGQKLSEDLANHFKNLDALLNTAEEELVAIEGIAQETAQKIIVGLQDRKTIIDNLLNEIEIVSLIQDTNRKDGPLQEKTFLITGTLSKPRKEIEAFIKEHGGSIKSSVSKNLDYLICGSDPGSKVQKAEKLGVPVITEEELVEMFD